MRDNHKSVARIRVRIGLVILSLGLIIFVLGVDPGLFGLDRSPVLGFVQISVFLVGLGLVCIGGYITLNTLWIGREKTIAADLGFRLIATGYVICVFSGMADVFGLGNQPLPMIPHFGPWQASGVIIGQVIIVAGLILLIRFQRPGQERASISE